MKKRVKHISMVKGPVALIIMDGWGLRKERQYNAPKLAKTPYLDFLIKKYPHSRLKACGTDVGLPRNFQGNSEVGHLNIGAGRIVFQALTKINDSIHDKTFFGNKAFLSAINNCRKHGSALHLMGLVQREGVHAMSDHLIALLELAKQNKISKVYIHAFTDGRDTPPKSANSHIRFVENKINKLGIGEIKTVIGRFYSMDRDKRWQRIKTAYDCINNGKGERVKSWKEAISRAYSEHDTDEFIKPKIIGKYSGVKDNDSIIFFNYRLDRARELTNAFVDAKFPYFTRTRKRVVFVCMTNYYNGVSNVANVAFENINMKNILGEVLSKKRKKQLRIAETEKYAHVTFFFNSEIEKPFLFEDRLLIPSPRDVPTYDLKPEMSAYKITEKLLDTLGKKHYDAVILNFANGDMVGHTGSLSATKKAVETVDRCLNKLVPYIIENNGVALIIADHGNCEEMAGVHKTSHTLNEVPCILVGYPEKARLRNGRLADVSPTLLDIMRIKKPKEMTGNSLLTQ